MPHNDETGENQILVTRENVKSDNEIFQPGYLTQSYSFKLYSYLRVININNFIYIKVNV